MVNCFYFVFYRQLTANSMSLAVGEKFQFIDDMEEYNIILNQWMIKSKMPQPFAYFGSLVKNGQIYVVGRISGFRPIVTSIILCGYIHLIKTFGQTYNIQ